MEQPRFLESVDVTAFAAMLRGIDLEQAFSTLPSSPQAMKETLGGVLTEFIGDPRDYLTGCFRELCEFYMTAADRRQAIVIWGD